MVCLFFVIKIPCTGYPYIWFCLVRDVSRVWSSSSSAPGFFSVLASCAFTANSCHVKIIKIHFFHCFTCIGKQPVQDSRKGWMELEKLHEAPKTGTEKRKKWGRIQLKEIMADWFPPGNMFLSTSILCQLGPTLSCRQSCEMSISCKDKRKITNYFCALIVYNFYYKKKTRTHAIRILDLARSWSSFFAWSGHWILVFLGIFGFCWIPIPCSCCFLWTWILVLTRILDWLRILPWIRIHISYTAVSSGLC